MKTFLFVLALYVNFALCDHVMLEVYGDDPRGLDASHSWSAPLQINIVVVQDPEDYISSLVNELGYPLELFLFNYLRNETLKTSIANFTQDNRKPYIAEYNTNSTLHAMCNAERSCWQWIWELNYTLTEAGSYGLRLDTRNFTLYGNSSIDGALILDRYPRTGAIDVIANTTSTSKGTKKRVYGTRLVIMYAILFLCTISF